MRYHTTADNVGITVNTDATPATLTLTNETTGENVIIRATQLGIIKLLRRGLTDILDAAVQRKHESGDA